MTCRIRIIFFLLFLARLLPSQNTDSLRFIIQTSNNDSLKVKAYADMSEYCEINEIPSFVHPLLKISVSHLKGDLLSESTRNFYLDNTADAFNNLAFYHESRGENKQAKFFFLKALSIYQRIGNREGIGTTYSNLGSVYDNMGDVRLALDYYLQSLKIREELHQEKGIGNNLHNIASLYHHLGDLDDALNYSQKSLAAREKANDQSGIAFSYNLLAQIFFEKGDTLSAIKYYEKSAEKHALLNEKSNLARANMNLGKIYLLRRNYSLARQYYSEALGIYRSTGQEIMTISVLNNLSDIEFETGKTAQAFAYAKLAYAVAAKTQYMDGTIGSAMRLSKLHASTNNYKQAYEMFNLYHRLSDSSQSNTSRQSILLANVHYDYQKKALADSIKADKDLKLSGLKLEQEQNFKLFAFLLLALSSVFALYMFRKFRLSQNQNKIIAQQKVEVETQKTLADSRLEISEAQKVMIQDSLNQLEQTQESLLKSKLEAEKANASKSTFIANVSHEIRTPLNAVLGFSELLKGSVSEAKYEKYIDNILAGGKSLMLLLNDILDLSKMEAGHLVFHKRSVSLNKIVEDCKQWLALKAEEKRIQYEVICDDRILNTQILLDDLRIRQILFNLLGNAIKFTSQGSVVLAIEAEGELGGETIDLKFNVSDTGIGIPESESARVFDAFRQVKGQNSREYGGTGLGLTITKNLVEAMNGSIEVNSIPGEGSTFIVRIKGVEVAEDIAADRLRTEQNNYTFKGQSVLLVEDTLLNRELIMNILLPHKLFVHCVENGREALDFLENNTPDLILMDLMMPVMDGYESTREIRKNKRLKPIPVVAVTALSYSEVEPGQIHNFDDYLQKPIQRDRLFKLLANFLEHE